MEGMSRLVFRYNYQWKTDFDSQFEATIRAKSVGPLRRNYQWFSPLPIFNVDPYRTGTDSTIERNIETGGGKGELHLDTRIRVTISLEIGKKSVLVL